MTICFLAHNLKDDNGGGTLARHVVLGLRDSLNCEITAFTYESSGLLFERAFSRGKLGFLKNFFIVRGEFKKCDVVHAFDLFPYGVLASLASIGLRKKFILTVVGTGSILPLYSPLYLYFASWTLRRASSIIAISRFTRDEIQKKAPGVKIDVINPGLDAEDYCLASKATVSEKVRKYQPYILSVGAIRKRKGHHLSIGAFLEVSKKFPGLNYVIVGKGGTGSSYPEELRRITKELNLGNRVFFVEDADTKEDLYKFYNGAQLFCLMSQNIGHDVEGFGIVFLEAAACGLPVVGTKGCGIDDAALDGENGILVPDGNIASFSDAIIRIFSDKNLMAKMKKKSLEFVKNRRWEEKIMAYKKIYQDM